MCFAEVQSLRHSSRGKYLYLCKKRNFFSTQCKIGRRKPPGYLLVGLPEIYSFRNKSGLGFRVSVGVRIRVSAMVKPNLPKKTQVDAIEYRLVTDRQIDIGRRVIYRASIRVAWVKTQNTF